MRPRDRNIAMVFQNYALYPYLNVFENIAFGLRARKFAEAEIRAASWRAPPTCSASASARPLSARALGRPAPAGRHRPGHRARRAAVPVRRAAVQPRCAAARRDARRDQAAAPGDRQDHDLRDPRPDRGDDPGRPDRPARDGRDRAAGLAARPVRASDPLRRRLPGLAADELRACRLEARRATACSSGSATGAPSRCRRPRCGTIPVARPSHDPGHSPRAPEPRRRRPRCPATAWPWRPIDLVSPPARAPTLPSSSATSRSPPSCGISRWTGPAPNSSPWSTEPGRADRPPTQRVI